MRTSPRPSICTTGPWGDVRESSRLRVPAWAICSSSEASVDNSDIRLLLLARRSEGRGQKAEVTSAFCPLPSDFSLVIVFEVPPEAVARLDVEDHAGVDRAR